MARKTIEALIQQANSALPDNTVGAISPSDIRTMITDFLDTITPMYGGLYRTTVTLPLTSTFTKLNYDSVVASFPPEWVSDAPLGTLARTLPAAGAMTSYFTMNGEVDGSTNGDVTLTLFRNGVATAWTAKVSTRGPGNPITIYFSAYDYLTTNATYELRAKTGFNASYTFSNFFFVGTNVPVRSLSPAANLMIPPYYGTP